MAYKTEQEEFWATEFGDNYINRNQNYISNIPFLVKLSEGRLISNLLLSLVVILGSI